MVYKGDIDGGSLAFTIKRGNPVSDKILLDTYTFGVTVFEILCVRPAMNPSLPKEQEWDDELTANYEHKLLELMLERNGQKIFGNVLFVFDPGGTFTVEKRGSFFVTKGNEEKLQCHGVYRKIIGYGWAVMLKRYLVDPLEMWWHAKHSQVSLFIALHEMDLNSKGPSRMKFFLIFSTLYFAGISTYHGRLFIAPWFSIVNIAASFIIFIYIIAPLCYWKFNTVIARKFPMISDKLLTIKGLPYDTTKVLTPQFKLKVKLLVIVMENYTLVHSLHGLLVLIL